METLSKLSQANNQAAAYGYGNAAAMPPPPRSLPGIISDVEIMVSRARELASRAYQIGDAVFGPVPLSTGDPSIDEPPSLEYLTRQLSIALSDIENALNRL